MTATYYLAPSLVQLRNEINTLWPQRDKTSDGWIGDTSHQARASDHNPDWTYGGIVRAIDIDKDGIDPHAVVNALLADDRTQYVIHEFPGKKPIIWSRTYGLKIGRVYSGTNPHNHHIHVSIRHTRLAERSTKPWLTGKRPVLALPRPSTLRDDEDMKITEKIGRSGITVGTALERAAAQVAQISRLRGQVANIQQQLDRIENTLKEANK